MNIFSKILIGATLVLPTVGCGAVELVRPDWNYNGISPVAGINHTCHITPFPQLLRDAGYIS